MAIPMSSLKPAVNPWLCGQQLDCDDSNGNANLISAEVCDGIDNDCNGFIDDDPAIIGTEPSCLAASLRTSSHKIHRHKMGSTTSKTAMARPSRHSAKWTLMVADGSLSTT